MSTVSEVAGEAYARFEVAERSASAGGGSYVRVRKGSPEWIIDTVKAAHDGGAFLPDDWTFTTAREAFSTISDDGDADLDDLAYEFGDEVETHTGRLIEWLGSYPAALGCCDQSLSDCGAPGHGGATGTRSVPRARERV